MFHLLPIKGVPYAHYLGSGFSKRHLVIIYAPFLLIEALVKKYIFIIIYIYRKMVLVPGEEISSETLW